MIVNKRKKIVINGRFLSQRITGVQRYAREILKELDKKVDNFDIELLVPKNSFDIPKYHNITIKKIGIFTGHLWEQIELGLYVFVNKYELINFCNTAPIICPGIITIHDVKFKVYPWFFTQKFVLWYNILFKNIINNSKKILTVSEFSKEEIVKYYDVNPNKINVIYPACDHIDNIIYNDGIIEKLGLKKYNYYFIISSNEPNKNLKWVIEEARVNENDSFIIAGATENKVFARIDKNDIPKNVILIGHISDGEMKSLEKYCKAFLFPTIYEGFGLPPLEALASGCKNIIVSDSEIMHEVYEDIPYYIDNEKYDYDLNKFSSKKLDIKKILDKYSWENSAILLLNLIKEYNNRL